MSLWGLIVNFALPPPLILTGLLVLPTPRVVRMGLLSFTRSFLFAHVVGSAHFRLVHFMLAITGATFVVTTVHTARVRSPGIDDPPNMRMSMLGQKWRQERNFWISCLTFLLWVLLYRLLYLMLHHEQLKARVTDLEQQFNVPHEEIPIISKKQKADAPSVVGKKKA